MNQPLIDTSLAPISTQRTLGGLLGIGASAETPFPLRSLTVRTTLTGPFAVSVIEQRFGNPLEQPMRARHVFPVHTFATISGMELQCGDLRVRAEVKSKQAAQQTFDEAAAAGHTAALVAHTDQDAHTLDVSNIPPGEDVVVRFTLTERLDLRDGAWLWRFPTTIAPRYTPASALSGDPHSGEKGAAIRVIPIGPISPGQPPARLAGKTTLDLEVRVEGAVDQLTCSSHASSVGLSGALTVRPAEDASLDRDFVLAVRASGASKDVAQAWTDGKSTIVAVSPSADFDAPSVPRDVVLVVDISGSMNGSKMDAAKLAMKTVVHGLRSEDRFRLIAFDTVVETLDAEFAPVNDKTLRAADAWIDRLAARGGTEMLPAINEALRGAMSSDRFRSVLFVTDGQVWNAAELLQPIADRAEFCRFYTLGIDTAVNSHLLQAMARVGRGWCELALPTDNIEVVVSGMEDRFGTPRLTKLTAEGLHSVTGPADAYAGAPAMLLLKGTADTIRIAGVGPAGACTFDVTPIRVSSDVTIPVAQAQIRSIEDRIDTGRPKDGDTAEIERLGIAHGIVTRMTSLVAVERRVTVDGEELAAEQPAEFPHQWQGQPGGPAMDAMGAAPASSRGVMMAASMSAPMPQNVPAPTGAMPKGRGAAGRGVASRARTAVKKMARRMAPRAEGRADGFAAPLAPAESMDAPMAPPSPAPALPSGATSTMAIGGMAGGGFGASAPMPLKEEAGTPPDVQLAHLQGADGSFGSGDIMETCAALIALVILGHTVTRGLRKRVVQKAARWLKSHAGDPTVDRVLESLASADRGMRISAANFVDLRGCGAAGAILSSL